MFCNPEGVYFISFAVVEWLDVFTRSEYKDIIIDSLHYCQKYKGMDIFAWCIMTNHVHLIFRNVDGQKPELLLGAFKRFTSKAIVASIKNNNRESRKEWLLYHFIDKFTHRYNADIYLKLSDNPDLSGEINE